jgi:hypothetical protein
MRRWVPILLSHLACLLCWSVGDASPLFDEDALLEIELSGPLSDTLRDTEERAERPFVLTVDGVDLDVMVRVRGKSRAETCRFPPLRLDFSRPADTVFAGQGKLKLVTHCNRSSSYELNVVEEYVAYRLVSLLVPSALRARLVRMRYFDTEKPGKKPLERFALLLEPKEQLAERIGGELAELRGVVLARLDKRQAASVFVAQYLIGNTDYSLVMAEADDTCCHNGILVEVQDQLHYVPYDFDRASFVDPSYARSSTAGGRRVRDRRYAGYCVDGLDLEAAIRRAYEARERIDTEIANAERVSGHTLRRATRFLDGFFREAEDPAGLSARLEKRCLD